jgi:hypothetical protein
MWSELHSDVLPTDEYPPPSVAEIVIGLITKQDIVKELKVHKLFPLPSNIFAPTIIPKVHLSSVDPCRRRSMMRQINIVMLPSRTVQENT